MAKLRVVEGRGCVCLWGVVRGKASYQMLSVDRTLCLEKLFASLYVQCLFTPALGDRILDLLWLDNNHQLSVYAHSQNQSGCVEEAHEKISISGTSLFIYHHSA